MTLEKKWLFGRLWLRSRSRAHIKLSEAEKLLDMSQYIALQVYHVLILELIVFALLAKSMKVQLDMC